MSSLNEQTPDRNRRIGELGEKFIQQRLDCGIDFDKAWDEWSELERKLQFMIVDCPDVRDYDDRRINDRYDRARMRRKAKVRLGLCVRSEDVSCLAAAAMALGLRKPRRPYHMDRAIVREFMERVADAMEQEGGYDEDVASIRRNLEEEGFVEDMSAVMERFAEEHALWAVPPSELVWLYQNHVVSEAESDQQ